MYNLCICPTELRCFEFTVKPRVCGLWRCWSPGMAVGHRQTFFQNVLPGFLGFGHRRLIQRICSPCFSVYLIDIGHRRQFALICSPCFPVKKENKSAQMSSCTQCQTSHGEQFKQNQRLCPKSPEYSKKQGEQICEMPLLCPNPGNALSTTIKRAFKPGSQIARIEAARHGGLL